ncbi:hypothetical protein Pan258_09020 [Symmachiella dynata]|nr:hypothetical protein Pan258_09020 [Symmachiella dynata]
MIVSRWVSKPSTTVIQADDVGCGGRIPLAAARRFELE